MHLIHRPRWLKCEHGSVFLPFSRSALRNLFTAPTQAIPPALTVQQADLAAMPVGSPFYALLAEVRLEGDRQSVSSWCCNTQGGSATPTRSEGPLAQYLRRQMSQAASRCAYFQGGPFGE